MKITTKELLKHQLPTGLLGVDLTADGQTAWGAAIDGVYRIPVYGDQYDRIGEHRSYTSGVALNANGDQCISSGYDGRILWHDLAERRVVHDEQAHRFWSWDLAVSLDRSLIASVTGQYLAADYKYTPAAWHEPTVKVINVATRETIRAWEHGPPVQAVAISPDNRYVAAGNLMGEVAIWEIATGANVAKWKTDAFTSWGIIKSHCFIGGIFAVRFSPDSEYLYVAGMGPMRDPMAGNGRQLWQKFAWRESPARKVDETHNGESGEGLMETLAFHPSGKFFVMAGRLRGGKWNTGFFNATDGALIHSLASGFRVTEAVFSADGTRLFLAGMVTQSTKSNSFGRLFVYDVDFDPS